MSSPYVAVPVYVCVCVCVTDCLGNDILAPEFPMMMMMMIMMIIICGCEAQE